MVLVDRVVERLVEYLNQLRSVDDEVDECVVEGRGIGVKEPGELLTGMSYVAVNYMAEVVGATNYSRSAAFLEICIGRWHDLTDWGRWCRSPHTP